VGELALRAGRKAVLGGQAGEQEAHRLWGHDLGPVLNGHRVNGVLTWIDPDGSILAQSTPLEGLLSNCVIGLPDSGCLVNGDSGIVSFAPDGQVRWVWTQWCTGLGCAPARDRIVTVSWTSRSDDSKVVSIARAQGLGLGPFVS
jgi:hypothetical protein